SRRAGPAWPGGGVADGTFRPRGRMAPARARASVLAGRSRARAGRPPHRRRRLVAGRARAGVVCRVFGGARWTRAGTPASADPVRGLGAGAGRVAGVGRAIAPARLLDHATEGCAAAARTFSGTPAPPAAVRTG